MLRAASRRCTTYPSFRRSPSRRSCALLPSEALHTTTDAAPCSPVVGGLSNGKQRVNEQPSEPSQAWEATCVRRDAQGLALQVHGGALRKRSAPAWIDFFTTTSSRLAAANPGSVCRLGGPPVRRQVPTSNSHARAGRRDVAEPPCVPFRLLAALAQAAPTWRATCQRRNQRRSPCDPDRTACHPPTCMPHGPRPAHQPTPTSSSRPCLSARPTTCECSARS